MKSILISSDFVYDSNNNPKLLEINTNTGIIPPQFPYIDFQPLKTFLVNNNYTKVVVVFNSVLEQFVNYMETNFQNDSSVNSLEFDKVKVFETFYGIPSDVIDSSTTFIIRAVYDSTAIVDSEYCANEINLFNLFITNNDTGSIPNLMFKNEDDTIFDNLDRTKNTDENIPDYFLKKSTFSPYVSNKLLKLSGSTSIDNFVNDNANILDTYVIQNYEHSTTNSIDNNKFVALRVYQLWYGSNLDAIDLGVIDNYAISELPTGSITTDGIYVDTKYRYSYVTNFLTKHDGPKQHGYREDSLVLMQDDTTKELKDIIPGDIVKSYMITSLPDAVENTYNWFEWKQTKSDYDSLTKTVITASVVTIDSVQLNDFAAELSLENNIKHTSLFGSGILTWLSGSDSVQFISATNIRPGDRIITSMGTGLLVEDLNIVYDTGSYFSFDVEDNDTIILKPADIIVHNYECFAAGTQILLSDETTKNIENIVSGDVVKSYNFNTNVIEDKVVGKLLSVLSDHITIVKLDNGTELKVTNDHPIYTNKGWSALDVELTKEKYNIEVVKLEIGDIVKLYDGNSTIVSIDIIEEPTMTFTLKDVEDNANFFANGCLVHNRPIYCFVAGTQITMADGTFKNIEDVVVGDEVITLNEETKLNEIKKVIDTKSPIHNDLVKYTLSNGVEVISTFDHPFYVNKLELASYAPHLTNERYQLDKNVRKIQKSDCVYMIPKDGGLGMHAVAIEKIEPQPLVDTQTHIITIEDNHNFYANGILTHNK